MPEYLSPGVYVEEVSSGIKPIEGVSTSTAGFVGPTERGPVIPRMVTSWLDYQRWFGSYIEGSHMPFAVQGFFDNGGQRLFVARVNGENATPAVFDLKDKLGATVFRMQAIGPGEWGNNLIVRVGKGNQDDESSMDLFRLTLIYYKDGIPNPFVDPLDLNELANKDRVEPTTIEDYDNLSAIIGSTNYILNRINSVSQLVEINESETGPGLPDQMEFGLPIKTAASIDLNTSAPNTKLQISAKEPGMEGNNLKVEVVDAKTENASSTFTLKISGLNKNGVPIKESFEAVEVGAGTLDKINESEFVSAEWVNTDDSTPSPQLPSNLAKTSLTGGKTIVSDDTAATVSIDTEDANTKLKLSASVAGPSGNNLKVEITPNASASAPSFTLAISGLDPDGNVVEMLIENITIDEAGITTINSSQSHISAKWVNISEPSQAISPAMPNALAPTNLKDGTSTPRVSNFKNGSNGEMTVAQFLGNGDLPANERTGLAGLETIDEVSLLCAPDQANKALDSLGVITDAVVDQCERLKDRFAILSINENEGKASTIRPPRDSTYGAVYHPWVRVFDPRTQGTLLVPPSGHVAGIYARSDIERGVHKAPANEVIRGIISRDLGPNRGPLKYKIPKGEHDILNPRGVNVIRDFRSDGRGIRVWGARTMSSDPEWKYVNVRRLFLFIEESIDEATQWVVFEPNHEPLWAAITRNITNFLISVWRSGALMGITQEEAFFVKCDRTTMTQDDIDNGRLICYIGVAPVKPAEFVIFRISQKTLEATG